MQVDKIRCRVPVKGQLQCAFVFLSIFVFCFVYFFVNCLFILARKNIRYGKISAFLSNVVGVAVALLGIGVFIVSAVPLPLF